MPSIESIARCVIIHKDSVLLCGAVAGGVVAYRYLPGGHIEAGETAREAVVREMIEEAGIAVSVGACVLVSENHFTQLKPRSGTSVRRHEYTLVFMAIAPTIAIESKEPDISFDWVPLGEVGGIDVRPASMRRWLVAHARTLAAGATPALEFHVEQS